MVKIKTYSIRKNGERGLMLQLPAVWARDLALKAGDSLDVYRDTENKLIIVASRPAKGGDAA
jgi:hypothetical protein